MQFSELITQVQDNLGRTDTPTKTMIKTAINKILDDISHMELDLYKTTTTVQTVASTESVSLSTLTRFKGFVKNGVTIEDGDNWSELLPMKQSFYDDTDGGEPLYFELRYVSGVPYLYLRDIPDAVYNIKLWWYQGEAELSADENTALLSTMYGDHPIIAGATYEVAKKLQIMDLVGLWHSVYQKELGMLRDWNADKEGREKYDYNIYV